MKKSEHRWKIGDRAPRIGDWVVCIYDWTPFSLISQGVIPYSKNSIGKVMGPLRYSYSDEPTLLKVKWFTDRGEVEWATHISRFKVIEFEEGDFKESNEERRS